ncbi:MAG TPA: ATP-binding protein [Verrucomicrobiota bacterium]|nr:ATP-binding protein [Verrucomicrobiota bacterium]
MKLQLYGFAAAVLFLAALVVWAGHAAWQELVRLRQNFGTVQTQSFHLAEHIEVTIAEMNEAVLRFELRKNPAARTTFETESEELTLWLAAQEAHVTTEAEADLLHEIVAAYGDYLALTRSLFEETISADPTAARPLFERLEDHSAPILALCAKLRTAERTALNQFVEQSYRSVATLQWLLVASVGLVVGLGFTATRLIYRARIAPLRAQVIQSHTLLERHEKLASLGTLAAGVAHEIRNPLTAINVRVHGLKKTLAAGSSEHEDVTVIDEEIRRLDRIVRDFLDFARPSAPSLVTVHVESLFSRVQTLLGAQWQESAIQFHVEPPPDLWVRVDTQQLEQVLINLVQNAADSIEGAGRITLRARAATARLAGRAGPVVILEVVDTGKGIPPEVQQRIFDPFFTTKESGTGLGLAIAASIVEKHGGLLQCHTQAGPGTTFGIVLPRAENQTHET